MDATLRPGRSLEDEDDPAPIDPRAHPSGDALPPQAPITTSGLVASRYPNPLEAALDLAARGFRVLPVHHPLVDAPRDPIAWPKSGGVPCSCGEPSTCGGVGKHPRIKGWPTAPPMAPDEIDRLWTRCPGANIGLAMGGAARLVALDVDGPEAEAALAALEALHGSLPRTLESRSGRAEGGRHLLFIVPAHLDIARLKNRASRLGPGLDVRAQGGQIVAPPSLHASGAVYAWTCDAPVAELPSWAYELAAEPVRRLAPRPPETPSTTRARASGDPWPVRYVRNVLGQALGNLRACGKGTRNDTARNEAFGLGGFLWVGGYSEGEAIGAMIATISAAGWEVEKHRETIERSIAAGAGKPRDVPAEQERARRPAPTTEAENMSTPFDGNGGGPKRKRSPEPAEPEPEEDTPEEAPKPQSMELARGESGAPIPHVANAIEILRHDIHWRGVIAFDAFLQQVVFRRAPAWYPSDAPAVAVDVLDDDGEVRLAAWMFRKHKIKISEKTASQAAHVVAKSNPHDSLVTYLGGLEWDGVPRLSTWLTVYLGARDTPYARFVGRAFPISAIARAFDAGAQVDHALILEGEQSEGKSSLLRALFGDRFSESPVDLSSKDRFVNLRGVWCQSFDELAGLLKSENETAKNYITATFDVYRPPYGRHAVKVARRCVFAGTVNPGGVGYLKDPTGNRRYWPIACGVAGPIDRESLMRDRDQLWAEAVAAYKADEKWWPRTTEEKAMCREEQSRREEDTPWDETVGRWLAGHPVSCKECDGHGNGHRGSCDACAGSGKLRPWVAPMDHAGRRYVTQTDVLSMCLQVPTKEQNRYSGAVAAVLSRLGWKRPPGGSRPRRGTMRVTAYYHPQDLANENERAAIEGREPFADVADQSSNS